MSDTATVDATECGGNHMGGAYDFESGRAGFQEWRQRVAIEIVRAGHAERREIRSKCGLTAKHVRGQLALLF